MRRFFGERERGYRYKHLADALSFIPYGCIVDEFQASRLRTSDWTPEERDKAYLELEKHTALTSPTRAFPISRRAQDGSIRRISLKARSTISTTALHRRSPSGSRALAERPRRSAPPLQTVRLGGRHDCLPQPCKTGRGLPIPSAKVPFKTLPRKFRASCKPSSRNNPTENAVLWRAATKQFSEQA